MFIEMQEKATFVKLIVLYFVSSVAPPASSTCLSCFSRLWSHHSSVWHWEGFLHPLRPNRSPLHHAGADRLRPEAHVPSGPRSCRPPAAFRHGASTGHRCSLPVAAGSGGAVLLCGASGYFQHSGSVLVVLGWHLLLFHLAVHHWTGGLCARDTAWAEVQAAVPHHCHGWVQLSFVPRTSEMHPVAIESSAPDLHLSWVTSN